MNLNTNIHERNKIWNKNLSKDPYSHIKSIGFSRKKMGKGGILFYE